MRTVVHLIESLGRGGAERRLVNDLSHLDRTHFRHIVCTLRAPHDLADEVRALGVTVHCLEVPSTRAMAGGMRRLARFLAANDAHIVHSQLFPADLLARLTRLLRRTPVLVTTLQSSVYEPGTEYLYSERMRLVDSWTGRWLTDAFVAVSAFVRDSAVRNLRLPAARMEVIPNSVETARFAPPDPARVEALARTLGVVAGDRVIVTIGRLDPPKGHRFLLEALAEVRRHVPSVRLLIVGDGPSREGLEALAREHGVADRVIFTGVRGEIPEILAMSEVFVLPTLSEGLPLTVLEAMAAGVPPVASRIGPTEEIVESGRTGFLVEPREPKPLAEAITRLLLAPAEARALGARARDLVEARFSARRCADALGALYTRLSGSAHR